MISGDFYTAVKSFHVIFMVAWFAGLFYLPRILIYQTEAYARKSPEGDAIVGQMKIMAGRLWYIITWPAGVLTVAFGIIMLAFNPALLQMHWMLVKLGFVVLLMLYHGYIHVLFLRLKRDRPTLSSHRLRLLNEVPTVLLFAIIFTVMFRTTESWLYGVAGILALGALLTTGVFFYRRLRKQRRE